jgi:death-on-curing protein
MVEKAAALGFSLIQNHPFVDGNKRTAHAVMEMC